MISLGDRETHDCYSLVCRSTRQPRRQPIGMQRVVSNLWRTRLARIRLLPVVSRRFLLIHQCLALSYLHTARFVVFDQHRRPDGTDFFDR